ncbi:MAG: Brp/Blh family beta-carotene 15,15'-dioxygenase [Cytophagaceae bacterium]|nr:Brp/Blh family beta-carotene 15,15'-dioxygenase [Cytophagaceae bacterium]
MQTDRFHHIATTPTYLTIALGVVLVGWQAAAGALPGLVQWLVFAGLLAGAGIPHGALDHLIDRETATRQGKPFSLGYFLARYVFTIALFALVWLIIPAFSLVVFLLCSAWHFGETDIECVPPTLTWTLTRFVAGGFVLSFLLLTHAGEVTPVLERIVQNHTLTMRVWYGAVRGSWSVWLGLGLFTCFLFGAAMLFNPVPINWPRLARLVAVLGVGYWLSLPLAFALYFGGWHSLSSFETIYGYLKKTHYNTLTNRQLWLKSLPFTSLSLASLTLFAWWWWQYTPRWDPLPLLFIFLSLITLPHLSVMHGMNSRTD